MLRAGDAPGTSAHQQGQFQGNVHRGGTNSAAGEGTDPKFRILTSILLSNIKILLNTELTDVLLLSKMTYYLFLLLAARYNFLMYQYAFIKGESLLIPH